MIGQIQCSVKSLAADCVVGCRRKSHKEIPLEPAGTILGNLDARR